MGRFRSVRLSEDLLSRLEEFGEEIGANLPDLVSAAVEAYMISSASNLPEYSAWTNMKQRCRNPASPTWEHYGGRGIRVAPRWDSFWLFFHDVGRRPGSEWSLDRIDVNGDYEPENVRWASKSQQSRNRRNNNRLTFKGQTKCIQDWADELGISPSTIRGRLGSGWSIKDTLTKKVRAIERAIEFRGESQTVSGWAEALGITVAAMCSRLNRWPVERALTEPPHEVKVLAGKRSRSR